MDKKKEEKKNMLKDIAESFTLIPSLLRQLAHNNKKKINVCITFV